jgi:hypothetical protein
MGEYGNLKGQEKLKAENQFLKMKLALERGMVSINIEHADLSPNIENMFLKRIVEFEKQFDQRKTIRLFDKIGRPQQFPKAGQISDDEIGDAYLKLLEYLTANGVHFSVFNPEITIRELYRFVTEELFEIVTEDINIPGMIVGYVYDDFYPDPVFENATIARDEILAEIFCKDDISDDWGISSIYFKFNGVIMSPEILKKKIHHFKSRFTAISLKGCNIEDSTVDGDECMISGRYEAVARADHQVFRYNESFRVQFRLEETGFWVITELWLEGLDL